MQIEQWMAYSGGILASIFLLFVMAFCLVLSIGGKTWKNFYKSNVLNGFWKSARAVVTFGIKQLIKETCLWPGEQAAQTLISLLIAFVFSVLPVFLLPIFFVGGNRNFYSADFLVQGEGTLFYVYLLQVIGMTHKLVLTWVNSEGKVPLYMRYQLRKMLYTEAAMGILFIAVFLGYHTDDLAKIVLMQTTGFEEWGIVKLPLTAALFFVLVLVKMDIIPLTHTENEFVAQSLRSSHGGRHSVLLALSKYMYFVILIMIFINLFLSGSLSFLLEYFNSDVLVLQVGNIFVKFGFLVLLICLIKNGFAVARGDMLMKALIRIIVPLAVLNVCLVFIIRYGFLILQ